MSRAHEKPPPVRFLADIGNGISGFSRAAVFWATVLPAVMEYQKVNKWKEEQPKDDAAAQETAKRQTEELHKKHAPRILELCLNLRGVYLKIGQVFSILPAIPKTYRKELRVLQDGVPPRPAAEIEQIIADALGAPVAALFASFEPEPVGSASVGQVHRARLHDGREVAVKCQYPDVAHFFASDMQQMMNAARMLDGAKDAHEVVEQMSKVVMAELDFRREAEVMDTVAASMARSFDRHVSVPRPIRGMVAPNVLVMTWLEGQRLTTALEELAEAAAARMGISTEEFARQLGVSMDSGESGNDPSDANTAARGGAAASEGGAEAPATIETTPKMTKARVAWAVLRSPRSLPALWRMRRTFRLLVDVLAHQILMDGCFSSDPHPGNLLLLPDGRVGLLDFGQHGLLNREQREWFARTVLAVTSQDEKAIANQARALGMRSKHDLDSTLAFHLSAPFSGNLGAKLKRIRALEREDPVIGRGEAALLLPFRPIALTRACCKTFGVSVDIARAFAPLAREVLQTAEHEQGASDLLLQFSIWTTLSILVMIGVAMIAPLYERVAYGVSV